MRREVPKYYAVHEVVLVGAAQPAMHAYHELLAQGHKVTIEQRTKQEWAITGRECDLSLKKLASFHYHDWSPSKPKPKHHNGRYNKVNRSKNRASREARKQNRR
ncbi:MAG: hypothetical protein ACK50N_02080 [Flavobacteriales bacterium]